MQMDAGQMKKMGKKPSLIDDDIAEISQRIMMELENASSKDLSEAKYAKKILQLSDLNYTKNLLHEIESVPSGAESVIEKRAVIKALLLSTWLQRLYFIIRAAIMSVNGMVLRLGQTLGPLVIAPVYAFGGLMVAFDFEYSLIFFY